MSYYANETRKSDTAPGHRPGRRRNRAMLAYADSPEGRMKIENARREFRDGEGIEVTPNYSKTWTTALPNASHGGARQ